MFFMFLGIVVLKDLGKYLGKYPLERNNFGKLQTHIV